MIQCLFKNAKHCVVNILDFKNFPVDRIFRPKDLSCWKARLNKLITELWLYLHKHTMQVLKLTEDSVYPRYIM
jgi:hypothetical protein